MESAFRTERPCRVGGAAPSAERLPVKRPQRYERLKQAVNAETRLNRGRFFLRVIRTTSGALAYPASGGRSPIPDTNWRFARKSSRRSEVPVDRDLIQI